jgi:hypothetical protein
MKGSGCFLYLDASVWIWSRLHLSGSIARIPKSSIGFRFKASLVPLSSDPYNLSPRDPSCCYHFIYLLAQIEFLKVYRPEFCMYSLSNPHAVYPVHLNLLEFAFSANYVVNYLLFEVYLIITTFRELTLISSFQWWLIYLLFFVPFDIRC